MVHVAGERGTHREMPSSPFGWVQGSWPKYSPLYWPLQSCFWISTQSFDQQRHRHRKLDLILIYVCVCVYARAHIYTYMHVRTYARTHVYRHTHTCTTYLNLIKVIVQFTDLRENRVKRKPQGDTQINPECGTLCRTVDLVPATRQWQGERQGGLPRIKQPNAKCGSCLCLTSTDEL